MLEPRTVERKGAEQGAKRAAAVGLELERRATVRARRMGVEKGADLLLEEVALEGAQEVFGLGQAQPEMLDALVVLIPTTSLQCVAQICSRRIAVLRSQATMESGF